MPGRDNKACGRELLRAVIRWLAALRAEGTHEALGNEGADRGTNQERLHAHFHQTGDATDGVVGVKGGEYQVTGERGTYGNLRGFKVANFPHHDDVRVATQDAAQTAGKGEADLRFHRDLHHARKLVLHRIFDGDDTAGDAVELG